MALKAKSLQNLALTFFLCLSLVDGRLDIRVLGQMYSAAFDSSLSRFEKLGKAKEVAEDLAFAAVEQTDWAKKVAQQSEAKRLASSFMKNMYHLLDYDDNNIPDHVTNALDDGNADQVKAALAKWPEFQKKRNMPRPIKSRKRTLTEMSKAKTQAKIAKRVGIRKVGATQKKWLKKHGKAHKKYLKICQEDLKNKGVPVAEAETPEQFAEGAAKGLERRKSDILNKQHWEALEATGYLIWSSWCLRDSILDYRANAKFLNLSVQELDDWDTDLEASQLTLAGMLNEHSSSSAEYSKTLDEMYQKLNENYVTIKDLKNKHDSKLEAAWKGLQSSFLQLCWFSLRAYFNHQQVESLIAIGAKYPRIARNMNAVSAVVQGARMAVHGADVAQLREPIALVKKLLDKYKVSIDHVDADRKKIRNKFNKHKEEVMAKKKKNEL